MAMVGCLEWLVPTACPTRPAPSHGAACMALAGRTVGGSQATQQLCAMSMFRMRTARSPMRGKSSGVAPKRSSYPVLVAGCLWQCGLTRPRASNCKTLRAYGGLTRNGPPARAPSPHLWSPAPAQAACAPHRRQPLACACACVGVANVNPERHMRQEHSQETAHPGRVPRAAGVVGSSRGGVRGVRRGHLALHAAPCACCACTWQGVCICVCIVQKVRLQL